MSYEPDLDDYPNPADNVEPERFEWHTRYVRTHNGERTVLDTDIADWTTAQPWAHREAKLWGYDDVQSYGPGRYTVEVARVYEDGREEIAEVAVAYLLVRA